jgi:hypothetical protein
MPQCGERWRLTLFKPGAIKIHPAGGAVAQLEARLDGIEEVEGSNPFGSTKCFIAFSVYILRVNQVAATSVRLNSLED